MYTTMTLTPTGKALPGWVLTALTLTVQSSICLGDVISYWRFEDGSGPLAADQTGLMNGRADRLL